MSPNDEIFYVDLNKIRREDKKIKTIGDRMGRIKTTMIKNIGEKLYKEHKNEFTTDFEKNKEIVKKYVDIPSKKLRNVVAGYITRLKKMEAKS